MTMTTISKSSLERVIRFAIVVQFSDLTVSWKEVHRLPDKLCKYRADP
jgi:hypothetical protein